MIKLCVTPKLIHSPAEHLKSSHTDVLKNTAAGTLLHNSENGVSGARDAASVVLGLLSRSDPIALLMSSSRTIHLRYISENSDPDRPLPALLNSLIMIPATAYQNGNCFGRTS